MRKKTVYLLVLLLSIMFCKNVVQASEWTSEGITVAGQLKEDKPVTMKAYYSSEQDIEYVKIIPEESATYRLYTEGEEYPIYGYIYNSKEELDSDWGHWFKPGNDMEITIPLQKDAVYYLGVKNNRLSPSVECTVHMEKTTDYWAVITEDADGNSVDATDTNVDGLTWDSQNCRLTLNGYNGNEIVVYNKEQNYSVPEHRNIEICINGDNTISPESSKILLNIMYANASITGNGTLNMGYKDGEEISGIEVFGSLTIDGPTFRTDYMSRFAHVESGKFNSFLPSGDKSSIAEDYGGNLAMKSGDIYAKIIPHTIIISTWENGESKKNQYRKLENAITAEDYDLTGGNIAVRYIYTEPKEEEKDLPFYDGDVAVLFVSSFNNDEYTVENCGIGYEMDDELKEHCGVYALMINDKEGQTVEELENVTPLDVDQLIPSERETADSENNNTSGNDPAGENGRDGGNNGKLPDANDNNGNQSNDDKAKGTTDTDTTGPKLGSIITDQQYNYKITKLGTNDGKTTYEVSVVSLKKKSVTSCKIADTVKIDGITYRVTSISSGAFANNKKFKKITIGKYVKTIGKKAFYKNTKATKLTINSTELEEIGNNTFSGMSKLKTVTIKSAKLKTIGKKAFYNDKKLTKVVLKTKKLKKVGSKAFYKKSGKRIQIKVPKSKKKKYKRLIKNVKIV